MKRWISVQITRTLIGAVTILFCGVLWQHSNVEVQASRFPQTVTRSSASIRPPAPAPPAPVSVKPTINELKAAVNMLQDELIDREEAYDTLQQSYESCTQNRDSPDGPQYSPEKGDAFTPLELTSNIGESEERETLNRALITLKSRLDDYMGATYFLQDKFDRCKSGREATVCWGFWPRDTSKSLHWKALPCDGG